ncbi:hypothetical protein MIAR_07000 [Microbacterium arabinogalactanolyticum]|uniref:Zinc finger DksA/TraR C4-type domain-containing protein n=2 Tax=Microbacterium arabinogalactanolyticum TaxID=69365 RepID=A0ABQ5NE99_9MICO|nr:hypothetical protein MIAR_07000 [Microbacterium arabinogalactanolyticum]
MPIPPAEAAAITASAMLRDHTMRAVGGSSAPRRAIGSPLHPSRYCESMSRISRDALVSRRADAVARATSAASALAELVHDRLDSNDDDEHDPEGVPLSSEWSRLTALSEAADLEVRQFDEALQRWDAGTYGICASCGRPIPEGRLEVRPSAELCVPCAEKAG